jgi:hypothetical protein
MPDLGKWMKPESPLRTPYRILTPWCLAQCRTTSANWEQSGLNPGLFVGFSAKNPGVWAANYQKKR